VALRILERLGYVTGCRRRELRGGDALRSIPYDAVLMGCEMPLVDEPKR
jgi:hypothetical protein